MQQIEALFLVTLASCFSIIHAFSLREVTMSLSLNNTKKIEKSSDTIVDRTKKLATDYLETLKKIMEAPPVLAIDNTMKGISCSHNKDRLVASDLSNYEQMVIMKKYPYLDMKDLDTYNQLPNKNSRQSLHSGGSQLGQDSNFCECSDNNGPNVDITNRGFSGFAIPTKALIKDASNTKTEAQDAVSPSTALLLIRSLEKDILNYEKYVLGYENSEVNK